MTERMLLFNVKVYGTQAAADADNPYAEVRQHAAWPSQAVAKAERDYPHAWAFQVAEVFQASAE